MCTASDMRIYNVDIKLKTRYNMPDNKQGRISPPDILHFARV